MLTMATFSHSAGPMMRMVMMRDGGTGVATLDAAKAERPIAIATAKPSALATMVTSSQIGRPSDANAPTPVTYLAGPRAREARLGGGTTTSDPNGPLRRPRHHGHMSTGRHAERPRGGASLRDR